VTQPANSGERDWLVRRLRLFLLAEADMAQAAAAARALQDESEGNGPLRRALETAIAVSYARPFAAGNRAGSLGTGWEPANPRQAAFHDALIDLRNQVYAHTDRTEARSVVDLKQLLGLKQDEGGRRYAEEWQALNVQLLPEIIGLAASQQERFREEITKLEARLGTD
jgi:hypothetical protein